jgi:DNA-binding XRE family transcriptional regulator
MSGKVRPSARKKTLQNVKLSSLSTTDKNCIEEVFKRYDEILRNEYLIEKDALYDALWDFFETNKSKVKTGVLDIVDKFPKFVYKEKPQPCNIGGKIKELRENENYTQLQLSELVGVSSQAISWWECGKSEPTMFNCVVLADIFGISLDELCLRENDGKE